MFSVAVPSVSHISLRDFRFFCLLAAMAVYAFWGTPTPDHAGWPEFAVGALLIVAAGVSGARRALDVGAGDSWEKAGRVLLLYGASIPVLTAIISGNDFEALARDLVFFLFLLLPLLMHSLFLEKGGGAVYAGKKISLFFGGVIVLGWLFSLRVLMPFVMNSQILADPAYLANAPTVLFTALFLGGFCGLRLYRGDMIGSLFLLLLALVPFATMALIVQRASIGAALLMALILLGIGFVRRPLRIFVPLFLFGLTVLFYSSFLLDVFQNAIHKTEQVGLNMRWQEALAVFGAIDDSVLSVLFGKGWGASVFSPAAGGVIVNFTHSLVTTFWLKTGLTGVFLVLFYLFRIGAPLTGLLFKNPVMALALAAPFLIDILFYASFKSLDFGLLLLLIILSAFHCERLQKRAPCSKQE